MYKKPTAAEIRKRNAFITNLMGQMTLEEKIGQLNLEGSRLPISDEASQKISNGQMGALLGDLFDSRFARDPRELYEIQKYAVNKSPHGIPLLFAYDVIHGHENVFPIPLASSCTWDLRHIETIARLSALEATANGINWLFSPMVELAVNPHWGRNAESSGSAPYLGARIAEAMVRGLQGDSFFIGPNNVLATLKHLIGGSAAADDYGSSFISEHLFHSFYAPFLAGARQGAGSVMTSFSSLNALPCHADKELVQRFRKDGFEGFVVSDYNALGEMISHGIGDEYGQRDEDPLLTMAVRSLKAGVDMDMASGAFLKLGTAFDKGLVTMREIDNACRRILQAKYRLGLFDDPYKYFKNEHTKRSCISSELSAAAREIAADSFVLLKNENNLLPLPKKDITIALVGPLADDKKNILGTWSFAGNSEAAVSVLEGIENIVGNTIEIIHARGANITDDLKVVDYINFAALGNPETLRKVVNDPRSPEEMIDEALAVAMQSDVIVAVMGEAAEMSGESACSVSLELPASQRKLLGALVKTGKPIVLVLMSGRPLVLTWEDHHMHAILETWHGGTQAGNAIADVIFGDRNTSGGLTMAFPKHAAQNPSVPGDLPTGRPNWDASQRRFTKNAFFDMPAVRDDRGFEDSPSKALYPMGYGLSYTTFEYGEIVAEKTELHEDEVLKVSVTVTNIGNHGGKARIEMYIHDPVASLSRPTNELKGFKKIDLRPQESAVIEFSITPDDLKFYKGNKWHDWEGGDFDISVGPHSECLRTIRVNWTRDPIEAIEKKPRHKNPFKLYL